MGFTGCTGEKMIELEGRLSVKGSEPHAYLNIEDNKSQKSYNIQNRNDFGLMQKQNRAVKLKVKLIKEAVGPGFPAVVEVIDAE